MRDVIDNWEQCTVVSIHSGGRALLTFREDIYATEWARAAPRRVGVARLNQSPAGCVVLVFSCTFLNTTASRALTTALMQT